MQGHMSELVKGRHMWGIWEHQCAGAEALPMPVQPVGVDAKLEAEEQSRYLQDGKKKKEEATASKAGLGMTGRSWTMGRGLQLWCLPWARLIEAGWQSQAPGGRDQ